MRVTPDDKRSNFTFHIFLNGKEIFNAIMADDEAGEVETLKVRNGAPIVVLGEAQTIKESGKVVIEKRPNK